MPFKPEFDWGAIISIGLLYVVSSVEVLGDTAALTKVGLNRTPTERETAGAIAGDAQNIGLVAMTKVVNRKVILSGGLILILASFVPAVAEAFNSLPQAVLGGCTIMMFGNIILSGFQMIAEAGFTQRNITIAALSLTIGIGFTQVSDIFAQFPALFQQIFASNCIAVAFFRGGRDPQRRAARRRTIPLRPRQERGLKKLSCRASAISSREATGDGHWQSNHDLAESFRVMHPAG